MGPDWWVLEHLVTISHESFHGFFYLEDTPELFHCNSCSFSWAWVMGLPHRSSECHSPTDPLGLLLKLPQRQCGKFWTLETGLSSSTVVSLCVWLPPVKGQCHSGLMEYRRWCPSFLRLFFYLFSAVLRLHYCNRAFSNCGLLTAVASLVVWHRL